jgi:hypothetical protein
MPAPLKAVLLYCEKHAGWYVDVGIMRIVRVCDATEVLKMSSRNREGVQCCLASEEIRKHRVDFYGENVEERTTSGGGDALGEMFRDLPGGRVDISAVKCLESKDVDMCAVAGGGVGPVGGNDSGGSKASDKVRQIFISSSAAPPPGSDVPV